ncbi:MAG: helix-hairpin-helix domain-containing protein [Pseudomonadota bacterium]|nr:helix-hairpin-helix domain-containing protein [Pseudomonadota bacterium]
MFRKFLVAVAALIAATAFAAVDANKGSQAELEAVKGIGPAISTLIINERKKGNFKDWNDMVVRVKGVGDKNAAKFSEGGLTVNGAAFAGAPAKTEASMPSRAATATKATASKAASAVKGGAAVVAGDVKEQKDAVKENVKDAKEKRAEKKAEKAEKKAEKAAAASAASSTKK